MIVFALSSSVAAFHAFPLFLTSSDPQGWKVQRSTLQTDRDWTDTKRRAVAGQK